MKKVLTLLLISAALFSCSHDSDDSDEQATYPVKFSVSGFTTEEIDFDNPNFRFEKALTSRSVKADAAPITDQIKGLKYMIYDFNGNFLNDGDIPLEGLDAGKFKEYLPVGTNTVVVVGFNEEPPAASYQKNINDNTAAFRHENGDFFACKEIIPVTAGSMSNQSLVISRQVGKVQLEIEDAIPSNIEKMTITVRDLCTESYLFASDIKSHQAITTYIYDRKQGDENLKNQMYDFYSFCPNAGVTCSMTIRCIYNDRPINDANDLVVEVENFQIRKNKITKIKGILFSAESDINITIDGTWLDTDDFPMF